MEKIEGFCEQKGLTFFIDDNEKHCICDTDWIKRFDSKAELEEYIDGELGEESYVNHRNAVLKGLENMKQYDGHGNGLQYTVNGTKYSVNQMINEIKNDTEIGNAFSQQVYDLVITYMGKFSQDVD